MGRMAFLLVAVAVLFFLTCVRVHYLPGHFGDTVTFEIVAPWR